MELASCDVSKYKKNEFGEKVWRDASGLPNVALLLSKAFRGQCVDKRATSSRLNKQLVLS